MCNSKSENKNTSSAYDNRSIDESRNEIDNSVTDSGNTINEIEAWQTHETDNSVEVSNEIEAWQTHETDNSVVNEIEAWQTHDSSTKLDDGAIMAGGDVIFTTTDGNAVMAALDFAGNASEDFLKGAVDIVEIQAKSNRNMTEAAFKSTVGGMEEQQQQLVKYALYAVVIVVVVGVVATIIGVKLK